MGALAIPLFGNNVFLDIVQPCRRHCESACTRHGTLTKSGASGNGRDWATCNWEPSHSPHSPSVESSTVRSNSKASNTLGESAAVGGTFCACNLALRRRGPAAGPGWRASPTLTLRRPQRASHLRQRTLNVNKLNALLLRDTFAWRLLRR